MEKKDERGQEGGQEEGLKLRRQCSVFVVLFERARYAEMNWHVI